MVEDDNWDKWLEGFGVYIFTMDNIATSQQASACKILAKVKIKE